jgi:spore coat polysaccharide biosynthesis protein SpsF (cytidylyltransferase family)/aryl-alcohol dehydrogenase-like predicted oxidoreductase
MNTDGKQSLVLIQSRLSSRRLPGKALLPIAGLPMVVLAAKRAANTGRNVKILTSNDQSDDAICEVLDEHDVAYFRGSLNNVLERFNDALVNLSDDTKVFRLTADNVLPDGVFLDEMEAAFDADCADIIRCDSEKSNMPYGVSAELTTVGCIRKAFQNSSAPYDIEHVTPYIYRNGISNYFVSSITMGYRNLRVTIDTFEDYLAVKSLFIGESSPTKAGINSLISNFQRMKYRPYFEPSSKPMTFDGVKFGLEYGATNTVGKISEIESIQIIRQVITEGIEYIDTAATYGQSEKVIGKALRDGWSHRVKVITKLLPFDDEAFKASKDSSLPLRVRNSILQSCVNLGVERIHTLMMHRAMHLKNNIILSELKLIREEGLIKNIGVSVQSPEELGFVLRDIDVSIIQMPYNILDNRWDSMIDEIKKARDDRGLVVHARSALLQGLLCSDDHSKWVSAGIDNSSEIVSWLNTQFKQHEKMSISDLCIGYVNSQDWIDSVVVGAESVENLFSNLQSISMPLMRSEALSELAVTRPNLNSESLNPYNWKINV